MMPFYKVTYEARRVGAVGSFEPHTVNVSCATPETARDIAFDRLHRQGLETRFPISLIETVPCICGSWEPTATNPDTSEDWCPIHGINGKDIQDKRLPWPE